MGKEQTGRAVTCMKTLLMSFNTVFMVLAIVLAAIGALVMLFFHKYLKLAIDFTTSGPSYVCVCTGAFMILLGTLGCCCTAKGQPVLLYIYAAFLLVVFVVLTGAGVSAWANRETLKKRYEEGLTKLYTEYDRSFDHTKAVDFLQNTLRCCGIHNMSDWSSMPYAQTHHTTFPGSCCYASEEGHCIPYNQGCYSVVIESIKSATKIFAGCALGLAGFQIFGVFITCCLARNINKTLYKQI